MSVVKVERVGGLGGFGMPNSRLKSRGECDAAALSKTDQDQLDKLFKAHGANAHPTVVDGFRYILTRASPSGLETIEVAESLVPKAVAGCVSDTIE